MMSAALRSSRAAVVNGRAVSRSFVSRSAPRMAGPEKQLPGMPQNAMRKWWHYHEHTNHQVVHSLSPFRQDHLTSLFKKMPGNLVHKVTDNFFDSVPAFVLLFGLIYWADGKFEEWDRETWD
eukprot:g1957.t1